eukprot:1156769-Pelagomonas_calceolata.AAC.1
MPPSTLPIGGYHAAVSIADRWVCNFPFTSLCPGRNLLGMKTEMPRWLTNCIRLTAQKDESTAHPQSVLEDLKSATCLPEYLLLLTQKHVFFPQLPSRLLTNKCQCSACGLGLQSLAPTFLQLNNTGLGSQALVIGPNTSSSG